MWNEWYASQINSSVLRPLFFLIYINDLSKNLSSNTKLFADDTSIFSPVKNISVPTDQVNNNFEKFSNWPCH